MTWPRGRYNGRRIVGVEVKFCVDLTWWGLAFGSIKYATAFSIGPLHMWLGAVYARGVDA